MDMFDVDEFEAFKDETTKIIQICLVGGDNLGETGRLGPQAILLELVSYRGLEGQE